MRPSHKNQKSFPKNTFSESHCQTDPRQFAAQLVLSAYYEASPRSLSYGFGLYIHSKLTSNSSTELWLTNHTLQLYTLNPQKKKKKENRLRIFIIMIICFSKNALFWRDVEEGRETGAFAVLVIKLGFEMSSFGRHSV